MKRRLLAFMLTLVLIFGLMPISALASGSLTSGAYKYDGVTYALNDGTLTVSGSGSCQSRWANFFSPSAVKNVVIENGVTDIGNSAFSGCSNLTSITIPNSVTNICEWAFSGCSSLKSVTIPDSVTGIGEWAFYGCSSLASITIPDSVTGIGYYTFYDCSSLTSVTIPESVTSIGYCAFEDCTSLESITIPDSVTYIGYGAFSGCTSLMEINVSDEHTLYSSQDGVLYSKNHRTIIIFPAGKSSSFIIPDSVTGIGGFAFSGCSNLTSITIPDSVTGIGDFAFYGCSSLESIIIPDSVTIIDSGTFEDCSSLVSITIPDSVTDIGDFAFEGCSKLTGITIPDGVTGIGNYTFYGCSSLESITIPDSVTGIGDFAFENCSKLTGIIIPDSVTSIGERVFYGCSSLESITIPDSVTNIGYGAFSNCANLMEINVSDEHTSYSSQDGILYSKDHSEIIAFPAGKSGSFIIPDSVTGIDARAFEGCSKLTSITIPDSITSIGNFVFRKCSSLKSVTMTSGITEIGFAAFEDCSSLAEIHFIGTEAQWNSITVDSNNGCLLSAKVYFEADGHTHSYGTDWDSDESNHWHQCACGEKADKAAHTLKWVIDKEVTATEKGSKHQECSVCGYKSAAVEFIYNDVSENQWFYEYVDFALENGLMKGTADGIFEPDTNMTREMFATVIYRMAESPSVEGMTAPFTDIRKSYAYDAIVWAYNTGVVTGVTATTFEPDSEINRAQAVTMLWRYAGNPDVSGTVNFTDAAHIKSVYSWAVIPIIWATQNGIVNGYPDGSFAPDDTATRAQVAKMLSIFSDLA